MIATPIRIPLTLLLLSLLGVLTGCGGAEPEGDPLPAPPSVEGLEPAAAELVREAAKSAESESGPAHRHYARVLHAHDFPAEAAVIYRRASKRNADAWRDLYLAGRALIESDPAEARILLERSRTLKGDYQPTHLWLSSLYLDAGLAAEALAACDAANRIAASPFAHVGAARVSMLEGKTRNLRRAQSHLERARSLGRRVPDVYMAYADYYRLAGRGRERILMERYARDEVQRFGFADALMREVVLLSRSREGLRRQVEGLVNIRDFEGALARAEVMLEVAPNDDDARHFKANVLLRLRRFDEVLAIVDDVLTRRPGDQELMVVRANALHALDRVEEAIQQLRTSYDRGEGHVATRYTLGVFLGPIDVAAAIPHLEWTLTEAPLRHPEVRLVLARVYEVAGRKADASKVLKEALAFDSTDELAQRQLTELGG